MLNTPNFSPVSGFAKVKDRDIVEKKDVSYEIYTLKNRLSDYKKVSQFFITKVNVNFEDVAKIYSETNTTDKEYLKYFLPEILLPTLKKWIGTHNNKNIKLLIQLITELKKDSEDTQLILKEINKYIIENLLPVERNIFSIGENINGAN